MNSEEVMDMFQKAVVGSILVGIVLVISFIGTLIYTSLFW